MEAYKELFLLVRVKNCLSEMDLQLFDGRRQKVVVDGETSESISVVSGVPQGSVLA